MKLHSALFLVLVAGALTACASETSDPGTGGAAGGGADAAVVPDGSVDGGSDGSPDALADQGAPDAAVDVVDEQANPDAAVEAGEDAPNDGATETGPSDGGALGDNVIVNPGFEFWSEGLPDAWKGATSNIADDDVADTTSSVHGGAHACRLTNTQTTHKRFSTATFALPDGHYDCTYWVRGGGEIRNAFHDGNDYSNYSGYTTISSPDWEQQSWSFNLDGDAAAFELIFSVRSTDPSMDDLQLDDVYCGRRAEPCDQVDCPAWATCDPTTVSCEPLLGRCDDTGDCLGWQQCDATNTCVVAPGRCDDTADCDVASATPVCDTSTHTCVAGDPCLGVTCDAWRECDPATALCELSAGRCNSTADCLADLPACDGATRTCVSSEAAANIVPNGGFESWALYDIPYLGEHLIPDAWYGLDIPGSSEIDPASVLQYASAPHTGALALQLMQDGVAERFTSDVFDVAGGSYTCAYWVRGKGSIRHRTYSSGGWSPYTDREDIDTLVWTRKLFDINSSVHDMRIIFYASYTDPAKDHIQLDDVVCTRDPS